ncbi:VOC family protein [uncultured Ruegeria sp.]|uniref:VOC family protein n=1 Tax=uncultured Ruegeria sp. TaxID=259304 RepID=UPI00261E84F3|nr:VOC family protein [uncultured Ruegeria sp.]
MQIHKGRLVDHIHLNVSDLSDSRRFYSACLAVLGRDLSKDTEHFFIADELFVTPAGDNPITRIHLAFQAESEDEVAAFHAAALQNGGIDNGKPGPRDYHPGYYAAYVLDPDGNNIEAVWHGPAERSAKSVVFTMPGG